MYRRSDNKSGLFLLEMTLVVFFFALTAAVYVRVFAHAQQTGRDSKSLTEATLIAQNLAEVWYAAGGDLAETASRFSLCKQEDDTLTLYFDSTWRALPANRGEAAFYLARLSVDAPAEGDTASALLSGELRIENAAGEAVYTLPLVCYPEAHTKEGAR
ncbi:MAG: hypothetical protein IJP92_04300 [Lachnospiraceae bacterium]|nr:hypothetical protein [Lachnospiraceae bacterium]